MCLPNLEISYKHKSKNKLRNKIKSLEDISNLLVDERKKEKENLSKIFK